MTAAETLINAPEFTVSELSSAQLAPVVEEHPSEEPAAAGIRPAEGPAAAGIHPNVDNHEASIPLVHSRDS